MDFSFVITTLVSHNIAFEFFFNQEHIADPGQRTIRFRGMYLTRYPFLKDFLAESIDLESDDDPRDGIVTVKEKL